MEAKGEASAKAAKAAPKEEAKAAGKEAESSKAKSARDALGWFFGAKVKRASVDASMDASMDASICWGGGVWVAGGCQTSPRASSAAEAALQRCFFLLPTKAGLSSNRFS